MFRHNEDKQTAASIARTAEPVKVIERISEEEVLRNWLAAELNSPRFGKGLRARLSELGCDASLITDATSHDPKRHQLRREVILARGMVWDMSRPGPVAGRVWQREKHQIDSLLARSRYAPHDRWLEMSSGSRMPHDVARSCRAGQLNKSHTRIFEQIAAAYRAAEPVPEIILLDETDGTLTALEGHARLTGLALARLDGPLPFNTIGVIVGHTGITGRFVSAFRQVFLR